MPVPLRTQRNETLVVAAGACWELTRWLPGTASYHAEPQPQKLVHAFEALARFHRAAATFPRSPASRGPSPKIRQRGRQVRELQSGALATIASALHTADGAVQQRGARVVDLFQWAAPAVAILLEAESHREVHLQPCICDVWHDHMLFTGAQVTGLVDFGAMRIDTTACDIARLLGSLVGDDRAARAMALEAYSALVPLPDDARSLVEVFDQSSVLLAGMNWLQWICVDGKRFSQPQRVLVRLDAIIERLENQIRNRGVTQS